MRSLPQVFLNTKKARNFSGQHPWVMSHSVIEPTAPLEAGQAIDLVHPDGHWIGRGFYNPASNIRVRLYQWDQASELDDNWICQQLARAVKLRQDWMDRHGRLEALRLVNSEGDGLSGLIVDQFGDYLVIQVTALAMLNWIETIGGWLSDHLSPQAMILRTDAKMAQLEGIEPRDDVVKGQRPAAAIEIEESGVRLEVDLRSGQKTGYYLDQRVNRQRAASWAGPGRMLDICCYQGGFSLAACKQGIAPADVVAVDSSAKALEQADRNAELNGVGGIDFVQADCFDYLEELLRQEQRFSTVVLDPPRMAGSRHQIQSALRAYFRLNAAAVKLLEPQGILVTCSCSGRVTRSDFLGLLGSVSRKTRRQIQIVESLGADFDHPVAVNCPETEYLKCFICRVG